jgi:hypothetical protein
MIDYSRTYLYLGGGFMTPGLTISATISPYQNVTPGWNIGLQGAFGGAFQFGYSKEGGDNPWFAEMGAGFPGASLTGYYVWEPF